MNAEILSKALADWTKSIFKRHTVTKWYYPKNMCMICEIISITLLVCDKEKLRLSNINTEFPNL